MHSWKILTGEMGDGVLVFRELMFPGAGKSPREASASTAHGAQSKNNHPPSTPPAFHWTEEIKNGDAGNLTIVL